MAIFRTIGPRHRRWEIGFPLGRVCLLYTVQIPSGQRDDNRRGGKETEGNGRNRTAVEGYIGAQPSGLEATLQPKRRSTDR